MEVVISGRHMDVTEDMRDEITKRFRAVFRIFPSVIRHVRVIIESDTFLYRLEALLDLTTQKTMTGTVQNKDFHVAVRALETKLCAQLRRLKERIESHHKRFRTPRKLKTARTRLS